MENSIKTHYVKNILLSFLTTNDQTVSSMIENVYRYFKVHQNLIKVLIQAMRFNEEETDRIVQF